MLTSYSEFRGLIMVPADMDVAAQELAWKASGEPGMFGGWLLAHGGQQVEHYSFEMDGGGMYGPTTDPT